MRILQVVHWPRSGIGVLLRDIVRHRSPDVSHSVLCLAPGSPVTEQLRAAGAEVHELADVGLLGAVAAVKHHVRAFGADVIHSHSITPRLATAFAAFDVPHVTTMHTSYAYLHERTVRSAVKRGAEWVASRTVTTWACVSPAVRTHVSFSRRNATVRLVPNGVDIDAVRAAAASPHERIGGSPRLVAIGRLDPEKAFDRLLHAVAMVRPRFPELSLVICGDGRQRASLEALSRQLGLADVAHFLGHVSNAMPFLGDADALVCSSLFEGFPLTVCEGMALRRPLIATPVDGLRAPLRHGETAFFARGFEPGDIADAITDALSDPARLARVAEAGRVYAEQHLDVRRTVAAYESIYRDATVRALTLSA